MEEVSVGREPTRAKSRTGIEWTDRTWNPVVGCTKVSQGCKLCYAKTIHDMRHAAILAGKKMAPQYSVPFEQIQLRPERLKRPLSWQDPSLIFVNSVSDLFHEDVPREYIVQVFAVMALADRHTFQVLTKRPDRMREIVNDPGFIDAVLDAAEAYWTLTGRDGDIEEWNPWVIENWPLQHIWLGTSVENQLAADLRIPELLATNAAVRWLSMEPLLEDVNLRAYARHLDWIVVGGESGTKKQSPRPMHPAWALSIRDQAVAAGVPFLFKQWGDYANETVAGTEPVLAELKPNQSVAWGDGATNHIRFTRVGKKRAGRLLGGRLWNQYPERVAA